MHTFAWIALYLALGMTALAITGHVFATDEGIATIRARLRRKDTTYTSQKGPRHETAP